MKDLKVNNMVVYAINEKMPGLPASITGIFSSKSNREKYYRSVKDVASKLGIEYYYLDFHIDELLQSENPEVVSDAPPPSGVYTQVRERDVSGQDSNASKASVTVPLGNMIESKEFKSCENCPTPKVCQRCGKNCNNLELYLEI